MKVRENFIFETPACGAGKMKYVPLLVQLLFLVLELTRIIISLGKGLELKGSLFIVKSGVLGAHLQKRGFESL